MFEKTKAFCDSFLDLGLPGFDLAVYQDGECILRHTNGYSDIENKIKMKGNERFNIYSCSKVITCVCALQLWERGLFSLDDKLSDYMTEFKEMTVKTETGIKKADNPILIRHLFEMTAGFSYDCASPQIKKAFAETSGKCPTRELMRYLSREPLLVEPGDRWEYSLCHDVLAALVEVISGEAFDIYVKKNVFDPVGMSHSTFMLPIEELDSLAEQYRFVNGERSNTGKNIVPYKLGTNYASGGAGGVSTVDDYILFMEALRTHKLLKPETLKLMMTDRLTEWQKRTYWLTDSHGFGLGVRCSAGIKGYADFGWGGASCAYLAFDPENKISLYFGAHTLGSPVQDLIFMLYRFVRAELIAPDEWNGLCLEMQQRYNYKLTY